MVSPKTPDEWLDRVIAACEGATWPNVVQGQMSQFSGGKRIPAVIVYAILESYKLGRQSVVEELRDHVNTAFDDFLFREQSE